LLEEGAGTMTGEGNCSTYSWAIVFITEEISDRNSFMASFSSKERRGREERREKEERRKEDE
jgi:hypothetical protein